MLKSHRVFVYLDQWCKYVCLKVRNNLRPDPFCSDSDKTHSMIMNLLLKIKSQIERGMGSSGRADDEFDL